MKVLEPGRAQVGWSIVTSCTGQGNGGGGCTAKLLVEQPDLYITYTNARDETTSYVTFECAACGVETDLKDVPFAIQEKLPAKSTWLANRRAEAREASEAT